MDWKIGFYPFLTMLFNRNKNKNYVYKPKGYIIFPNMYDYSSNLIKIKK